MSDLVEFLLARIAEDGHEARVMMREYERGGDVSSRRWRRVLSECEAKRRIVERCRPAYVVVYQESERLLAEAFDQETVQTEAHSGPVWPFAGAEDILRDLASIYADHPDYRDEWRP